MNDLVNGVWSACGTPVGVELEDPATGRVLGPALGSSVENVSAAIAAADDLGSWDLPAADRADILDSIAAEVQAAAGEIVLLEARSTGVPIRQTTPLGMILSGAFALAAAQLRTGVLTSTTTREDGNQVLVERLPWGPVACLVPWNAPAPMAAHKVANALAAGCPTILKPSEYASSGTERLAVAIDTALRAAGAPPALFQLLHGGAATGAHLVGDARIRAVSFTGGLAGGRAVASACAYDIKPVQLELGGNNPLIVLPDADEAVAVRAAADLLTTLNGQWCRALGRLIVPAGREQAIVDGVLDRIAGLRAGDPADPATDYGPLIHSGHRAAVEKARDGLGGTVHTAKLAVHTATLAGHTATLAGHTAELAGAGNFLAPALVTGADPARTTEEIFGPVAAVHGYRTVGEAIALANGTRYGLEGYVIGADEAAAVRVARRVRAGEVKVNGSSIMSLHLFTPRPAWGISGYSTEGTAETLLFFTNPRVVGVENGFALHNRS
ncbi:aldehyde dehydrogenase [Actinoplanes sp. L3-i22]|uniref:aldehyde dehydrogenase family protein n=1 Tax=Actinoplanes sp. L3-i22 TaxID=2836373 RepID=UPI001C760579|nr:aldehyde dehydrogenase family protein [Actinoplanes sp. L3-i22]BCY12859.1 aldehyde dehydrogenase [Actinoplanes sp. L3-i22]